MRVYMRVEALFVAVVLAVSTVGSEGSLTTGGVAPATVLRKKSLLTERLWRQTPKVYKIVPDPRLNHTVPDLGAPGNSAVPEVHVPDLRSAENVEVPPASDASTAAAHSMQDRIDVLSSKLEGLENQMVDVKASSQAGSSTQVAAFETKLDQEQLARIERESGIVQELAKHAGFASKQREAEEQLQHGLAVEAAAHKQQVDVNFQSLQAAKEAVGATATAVQNVLSEHSMAQTQMMRADATQEALTKQLNALSAEVATGVHNSEFGLGVTKSVDHLQADLHAGSTVSHQEQTHMKAIVERQAAAIREAVGLGGPQPASPAGLAQLRAARAELAHRQQAQAQRTSDISDALDQMAAILHQSATGQLHLLVAPKPKPKPAVTDPARTIVAKAGLASNLTLASKANASAASASAQDPLQHQIAALRAQLVASAQVQRQTSQTIVASVDFLRQGLAAFPRGHSGAGHAQLNAQIQHLRADLGAMVERMATLTHMNVLQGHADKLKLRVEFVEGQNSRLRAAINQMYQTAVASHHAALETGAPLSGSPAESCRYWAKHDSCKLQAEYMQKHCAGSCPPAGLPGSMTTTAPAMQTTTAAPGFLQTTTAAPGFLQTTTPPMLPAATTTLAGVPATTTPPMVLATTTLPMVAATTTPPPLPVTTPPPVVFTTTSPPPIMTPPPVVFTTTTFLR